MDIIYVLLPLSLGLALAAVAGFLWANKHKQFDDMNTPAKRILLDESNTDRTIRETEEKANSHHQAGNSGKNEKN